MRYVRREATAAVAVALRPLLQTEKDWRRGWAVRSEEQAMRPFSPRALSLRLMLVRGWWAREEETRRGEGGREGRKEEEGR